MPIYASDPIVNDPIEPEIVDQLASIKYAEAGNWIVTWEYCAQGIRDRYLAAALDELSEIIS